MCLTWLVTSPLRSPFFSMDVPLPWKWRSAILLVLSTFDGGGLNFWVKVCCSAVMVILSFFGDASGRSLLSQRVYRLCCRSPRDRTSPDSKDYLSTRIFMMSWEFEHKDTWCSNSTQERGHSTHETWFKLERNLFFQTLLTLNVDKILRNLCGLTCTLNIGSVSRDDGGKGIGKTSTSHRSYNYTHSDILVPWPCWHQGWQ